MSSLPFLIAAIMVVGQVLAQDGIGFPEAHEDTAAAPSDNRLPLYMPGRCSENELLYPGDQNDDWICDCRPSYIFHPDSQKCHPAYEQGPCAKSQMLVMPKKGFVPVCVVNVCGKNKDVRFEGKCVTLGRPCRKDTRYVYGVNATSVQVQCLKNPMDYPSAPYTGGSIPEPTNPIQDRFNIEEEDSEKPLVILVGTENLCTPGCKRKIEGNCPKPPATK